MDSDILVKKKINQNEIEIMQENFICNEQYERTIYELDKMHDGGNIRAQVNGQLNI